MHYLAVVSATELFGRISGVFFVFFYVQVDTSPEVRGSQGLRLSLRGSGARVHCCM